ncbi:MAG: hypothetical protein PHS48_04590, partial [Bacteroidales bacterium]|nr:hypothetical protein [Bacteroidales bacterium]
MAVGCNPSRRVAQGEYLLNSVRLKVRDRSVPVAEIKTQLTQQPNERILGARFHLWLYNISNPSRDSEFRQGLRKAGEEPVIWKQEETEKSKQQILSLLMSRGYFYAQVKDTIRLHRKKAEVLYRVDLGIPYRIGKVDYDIKDPGLRAPVLSDTLNSEIKSGALLDQQLFTKERSRIESLLRQSGYYAFSEDYIHYKVDTFFRTHTANVQVLIENIPGRDSLGRSIERPHQTYIIKGITVDIQSGTGQEDSKRDLKNDTVVYSDMTFISPSKPLVKPLTVSQFIKIRPDTLYNVLDEENTYQRLSRLRSFRLVNIRFEESFQRDTLSQNRFLDARISLSPFKRHSLSADFQATYAKGDPGGAVVLNYQNLSLFRNAGIFNLRTRIAMESLKERGEGLFHNTKEYGTEASLDLPKFLLFRKEKRLPDHANSRTILSVGYNYLQRPE